MLVAEMDGAVAAVGCLNSADEIGLNYVAPQARFRGVSKALLKGLEAEMVALGTATGRLKSTQTAHRFYLAQGWEDLGPLYEGRFIHAYAMEKRLG